MQSPTLEVHFCQISQYITLHRWVNGERKEIRNVNSFPIEKASQKEHQLIQTKTASFNLEFSELYEEQLDTLLVSFPEVTNHTSFTGKTD